MNLYARKIIFPVTLLLAMACAAAAQNNSCNLRLDAVTFIEGTTDTKPVEEVSLTLTARKNQRFLQASAASPSLFEGLPEGTYKIAAAKPGFRTTKDLIYISCSNAGPGPVSKMVIMWEGDQTKTVDYTGAWKSAPAKSGKKDQQIAIGEGDGPPRVSGGVPAATQKTRPDAAANAASNANTASKNVISDSALVLAKPTFPPAARAVGASGTVQILVTIDEDGYVIEAKPVSGHPLLRAVSALAGEIGR